jgi:rubrerythrin
MKTNEEFNSVTQMIEDLIRREENNIASYEQTIHSIGDSLLKPILLSIVQEKREHRDLLKKELDELNEQFELDEAII